jgi:hypothetical protein
VSHVISSRGVTLDLKGSPGDVRLPVPRFGEVNLEEERICSSLEKGSSYRVAYKGRGIFQVLVCGGKVLLTISERIILGFYCDIWHVESLYTPIQIEHVIFHNSYGYQ